VLFELDVAVRVQIQPELELTAITRARPRNYTGGASMPPSGHNVTIHFLSADGTFKRWAELDGCTGTPMDSGGGCMTYTECNSVMSAKTCASVPYAPSRISFAAVEARTSLFRANVLRENQRTLLE
jgi:hypothetical protein